MLLSVSLALPPLSSGQPTVPATVPPRTSEPPAAAQPEPTDRPVSWKRLFPNLLNDQKRIWTFPARLAGGQSLIPTAAVLGTTAGLIAFDPIEASYFRRTSAFHRFNGTFTGRATMIGTVAAPISLYAAGLIRKDSKMQQTALLAAEAVADSEVVTTLLKNATRRVRPAAVPIGGNYSDTWFESGGSPIRGRASFPSGHTIAAFSVATVISRRYGQNHRWVPYVAYSLAALVGASRLTLSAHFVSDVFVGGALGYSISRFTVLRQ
jgi:membrane-associated phospholipid phosphatase